jgi:hypothetical protein
MSSAGKASGGGGKRSGAKDPAEALRPDKRRRDMDDDSDLEIDRCLASRLSSSSPLSPATRAAAPSSARVPSPMSFGAKRASH